MSAHDEGLSHTLSDHEENPSPLKKQRQGDPPPRGPLITTTNQTAEQDPFVDTPAPESNTPSNLPLFGAITSGTDIDSKFKNLARWRNARRDGLRPKISEPVSTTTSTDVQQLTAASTDSPQTATNDLTMDKDTSNDNGNTSATPTIATTTSTLHATTNAPHATTDTHQTIADAPPTSETLPTATDALQTTTEDLATGEGTSDDTLTPTLEVWDWEEAPVLPSREFKVIKVFKTQTWRKASGEAHSDSQSLDVWTILVHNQKQPEDPTYEVYGVDAPLKQVKKDTVLPGGVLDSTVCANEGEVRELGAVVCNLLDRLPFELSMHVWHTIPKGFSNAKQLDPLRRLVQARALDVWKSPFDRSDLHQNHRDLGLGIEAFAPNDVFSDIRISYSVRVLHSDQRGYRGKATSNTALKAHHGKVTAVRVTIEYDSLDVEKVSALPDIPAASFAYVFTPASSAPLTHQQQMLLKAFNTIQQCLSFKVGSKEAIRNYIAAQLSKLTKSALHKPIPTKPPPKSKVPFQEEAPKHQKNKSGLWRLNRMEGGLQVMPHSTTSSMFVGKVPTITVRHGSSVMAAHVLNQMIAYRTEQRNLDDIWEAGCLQADHVSLAHVSLDFVKDNYCACDDTTDKSLVRHVCMLCFDVFPCSALPLSQDRRRICQSHIDQGADESGDQAITIPLFRRLARILGNVKLGEMRRGTSPADVNIAALRFVLDKFITDAEKGLWQDAYDGVRVRTDGWLGATAEMGTLKSPFQISVDAVHRFIIRNGIAIQHHPENVVLTALCLNSMKSKWGVAIVGIVGAAARQAQKEKDGAVRDLDFWHDFNNAMERLHHLNMQVTSLGSKRNQLTADMIDDVAMATYLDSLSTSNWSPRHPSPVLGYNRNKPLTAGESVSAENIENGEPPNILIRNIIAAIAALASKVRCPNWPRWSSADKKRLSKLVNEMQANSSINPKRLRLPRSKSGAPWPFMKRHMFTGDEDLWDLLFHECIARYWRLFYTGNIMHDTDESPDTILLEIIVQWFRNGGVDKYIRCEMTIFLGHPQSMSLGRSDDVLPGSVMRTGWTVARPVSLRAHYEMDRSTIVVQPLFMNQFWSDFSPDLHQLMFKLLCELPVKTVHFGPLPRYTDPVEYPKESVVSRRYRGDEADVGDFEDVEDEFEGIAPDGLHKDAFEDDAEDWEGHGDEEEISPEDRESLQDRLDELNMDFESVDPGVLAMQACQDQLSAMRRAVAKGDKSSFDMHYNDLIAIVQTLLETASQLTTALPPAASPPPATEECSVCHRPAIEDSMLRCSNPKHEAVFHFWCLGTNVPHDGVKALCPGCSSAQQAKQVPHQDQALSRCRNMVNLGASCYMSSSVHIMRNIKPVVDFISDDKNLVAKSDAKSGRFPKEWLDGYILAGRTDEQVAKISAAHMEAAKVFCNAFASQSRHLDTAGKPSLQQTNHFFDRLRFLKPRDWLPDVMNDSADLFNALLDYMVLVTDSSEPSGRGKLAEVVSQQQQWDQVNALKPDSFACYGAYVAAGRSSPLVGRFWMQSAQEYECRNCATITRSFNHEPWFNPELPPKGADVRKFTLVSILEQFTTEPTDESPVCRKCNSLTYAPAVHRKITVSPQTLMVAFKRFNGQRLEHVDLPEYLDLSPYADKARLPSDPGDDAINFNQKPIYRVMAINMYRDHHFVAYVFIDGTWYMFDDLSGQPPVARHPQSALLDRWVPYYAVYEQLKDKTSLPLDLFGEPTMGHIFDRTARAPAAKVQDLYADEINADTSSDDDLQGSGTGDEPKAPGVASDNGLPGADVDAGADAGADADLGAGAGAGADADIDDGSHDPNAMDAEFPCDYCPLTFPEQGLLHAHIQQTHPADTEPLLGDKLVQKLRKDLQDVHQDIIMIQENHDNLHRHVTSLGMKQDLDFMQRGRMYDGELSRILAASASDEKEDAEELQRQCARKLKREVRLREWATVLSTRSQVSKREVEVQKALDDFEM